MPKNQIYKLFFLNWFFSLPCVDPTNNQETNIRRISDSTVIKWYDNKEVHILSNYTGIEPVDGMENSKRE